MYGGLLGFSFHVRESRNIRSIFISVANAEYVINNAVKRHSKRIPDNKMERNAGQRSKKGVVSKQRLLC